MEGHPGSFGPTGANYANIQHCEPNCTSGRSFNAGHPAWTTGDYVTLADGSEAFWDGGQWQAGRAGSPSGPLAPVPVYVPTGITPPTGGAKEWTWQPAAFSAEIADIQASLPTLTPSRAFVEGDVTDSTARTSTGRTTTQGPTRLGTPRPRWTRSSPGRLAPGWARTTGRTRRTRPPRLPRRSGWSRDSCTGATPARRRADDATGAPWEVGQYSCSRTGPPKSGGTVHLATRPRHAGGNDRPDQHRRRDARAGRQQAQPLLASPNCVITPRWATTHSRVLRGLRTSTSTSSRSLVTRWARPRARPTGTGRLADRQGSRCDARRCSGTPGQWINADGT